MIRATLIPGGGACGISMDGADTWPALIEKNWSAIAQSGPFGFHIFGNAAGYRLHSVRGQYESGILGGEGGVEVQVEWSGHEMVSGSTAPHNQTTRLWFRTTDRPQPFTVDIR